MGQFPGNTDKKEGRKRNHVSLTCGEGRNRRNKLETHEIDLRGPGTR